MSAPSTPRTLRQAVFAVALLIGSASPALAELGYLEYSAGAAIAPNQNIVADGPSVVPLSGSANLNPGYSVGLAAGTTVLTQGEAALRGEVALNWRSNEIDSLSLTGEGSSSSGDLGLFTAMLNAYVDYDLRLPIVPFIGAGVGYGLLNIDIENSLARISDDASVFAWNVMVGGTLAFTTTTDFTLGYRYLATTDPKYSGRTNATAVTPLQSQRYESEYDVHEIVVGMRVNF